MPRDGGGVYTRPAGAPSNSDTSDVADINTPIDDLVTDMNTVRPIVAGGTGSSTIATARTALRVGNEVLSKSGAYTVVAADRSKIIDCTAALTLTLTAAATLGDGFMFTANANGGDVTIDPDSAELVDGAATLVVPDGQMVDVFCTGTAWLAKAPATLLNVVEDTTPQLGGDLDVNGNSIVSASAGDIAITPDTTGSVVIDGLSHPQADGSADEYLKTDGAGQLAFAAPASAVLDDTTLSASADYTFTGFSATYNRYVVHLSQVLPATDGVGLWMRFSATGGAPYDSGASDYAWGNQVQGSGAGAGANDAADSEIQLTNTGATNGVGTAAGEYGISGTIEITGANSATYLTTIRSTLSYDRATDGALHSMRATGRHLTAEAHDAFQLVLDDASNMTSGRIWVIGYKD